MNTFASVNGGRIGEIATNLGIPEWLAEAIIVEYLPCRRFFEKNAVVLFDFGLVDAADVRELPRPLIIMGDVTLFHNVTGSVLRQRAISGFIGWPMAPRT
ncbi:MAG TPA: hypothetical protein VMV10_07720 [Pirellulales bacterium]|nr:hypothetical protein [Pirellulales bacterium]